MNIYGMLAASLLCAATPSAPHAKVAAAKPASVAAPAKPAASNVSKPAAVKPVAASRPAPAPRPAERVRDLRASVVYRGHSRGYWINFCVYHPFDPFCQGSEFAASKAAPVGAQASQSAFVDPFATATQPSSASPMPVNQTAFSAPAAPMVKVSDDLAASVSLGAVQADILQKLGEPHSRISGDVERYTYFLQSGGSLKLDFEDGHVTQMRKASN
jgi:hypothetical protein